MPRLIGVFLAAYILFNLYTLIALPHVYMTVRSRPWILLVIALAVLVILNIPREFHHGREFRAFLSSCLGMALMMAAFGFTYYPNMVLSSPLPENSLTIVNASSLPGTLWTMFIIALIGIPIVLIYTTCIYYIFRGKTKLTSHSY